MCVIAICQKTRINKDDFEACAKANQDGFGIAWFHGSMVKYRKSMKSKEIELLAKQVPLPYVLHFRLASVGGKKLELCHPFPISNSAPADRNGIVKRVLFHNGHISNWKEILKTSAKNLKETPPSGHMSDTRAVAWIADKAGLKYIDKLPGKFVVMSQEVFSYHGSWDTENDILYSNLFWKWRSGTFGYTTYDFSKSKRFHHTQEPPSDPDWLAHYGDRWRWVDGKWKWIDVEPPTGRNQEEIKDIKDCQETSKQFMSECGLITLSDCHKSFQGEAHTETEHRIMCPRQEEFQYSGNAMMCCKEMQGKQHGQQDHDLWCKRDYLDRSYWCE